MSESTTLAAEGPGETAFRSKVKDFLHGVIAVEVAKVNPLLVSLIPGWASQFLAQVVTLPKVQALEVAWASKAADALTDAIFFGADELKAEILAHVSPQVRALLVSAEAAANVATASEGALHLEADEVKALLALRKAGTLRHAVGLS